MHSRLLSLVTRPATSSHRMSRLLLALMVSGITASALLPTSSASTPQAEQPAQPDIVEVVAQGMGVDANSALLNAYSNAVQQALGLYVDAETLVQNDEIVRDKILTYSKGFIQEATTIKQSQANGLFQVNIRAKVKRQKLLEQAKANNITVKAVEGVSLHAQVISQVKQEQDAKALLEKILVPLMDATLLRAELVPPNKDQPNPKINKASTDEKFVTLDYKINLWIDEPSYFIYIKSSLIPVLNQISIRKGELTANYKMIDGGIYYGMAYEDEVLWHKEREQDINKELLFNVLTWKNRGLSTSKWQWFALSKDTIPKKLLEVDGEVDNLMCEKAIEMSLVDEKNEVVALGNKVVKFSDSCRHNTSSTSPFARSSNREVIRISPYFSVDYSSSRVIREKLHPIISVKIHEEDIPRVKNAKLEVKIRQ